MDYTDLTDHGTRSLLLKMREDTPKDWAGEPIRATGVIRG